MTKKGRSGETERPEDRKVCIAMPGDEINIPEQTLVSQGHDIEKLRGRLVACSPYFVEKWMPLLGATGTAVVLALRSRCFYNRKTGETRDEIKIRRSELAAMCAISVDTLSRELHGDKKRAANPDLNRFVEVRKQFSRDVTGRVSQDENVYKVAMFDPVHPDDEAAVEAYRAQLTEAEPPGPQNAVPVGAPGPQNAEPGPQNAAPLIEENTSADSSRLLRTPRASRVPQGGTDDREGAEEYDKPSLEEATAFFAEQGLPAVEASRFWNCHQAKGWFYHVGAPVRDWRRAARHWIELIGRYGSAAEAPPSRPARRYVPVSATDDDDHLDDPFSDDD